MIIDRYLISEIVQTMAAVLFVLLLIFMGRYFAIFLADAAAGEITGGVVLDLLLLRTLSALNLMLPFALYISILLAFGRLYKDNEMTALAASGVTTPRILLTVFSLGLLFALLVGMFSLWLSPWAERQRSTITFESEKSSMLQNVLPGQFNELGKRKDAVFYVEEVSDDNKQLSNVFAQIKSKDTMDVFSANKGYQYRDEKTGDTYLVLIDGFRYQGLPGKQDFLIQEYEKNAIRIVEPNITQKSQRNRSAKTSELLERGKPSEQAELQWRISMPITTLLLAMLGVLISRTSPRQGRFSKLFLAILIYIIYSNAISIGRTWIEQNKVPVEVGVWWVHLVLLIFIIGLLYNQVTGRRFRIKSAMAT
ncbi:LPS export ABC transporter permease LptF [Kaarinaea lacus]